MDARTKDITDLLRAWGGGDDALTGLSQLAPRQAKVVELRYFGGLTEDEIEAALEISRRTIRRDWDSPRRGCAASQVTRRADHREHPRDSGAFAADRGVISRGS